MKAKNLVALSVAMPFALLVWTAPAVAEEAAGTAPAAPAAQPVPRDPKAVEIDIERRRDRLDRQRDRYWDWTTGRRWRQPPWETAWDDWTDARSDAAREAQRQRRLAIERQRDAWQRWYDPWQQWRDDADQAWQNAWDLDRLARDEFLQARRFRGPYGGWGPWGY